MTGVRSTHDFRLIHLKIEFALPQVSIDNMFIMFQGEENRDFLQFNQIAPTIFCDCKIRSNK